MYENYRQFWQTEKNVYEKLSVIVIKLCVCVYSYKYAKKKIQATILTNWKFREMYEKEM